MGRTIYSGICSECNKWFYCNQAGYVRNQHLCSSTCFGKSQMGEKNKRWKKGSYIESHGYIIVSKNGKKIKEHRLVMEQHLNRKLQSFEDVHHRNGIKIDNRIENLELWTTRKQPSGQRVSDVIEFVCNNYKNEIFEYLHIPLPHITPLGA